MEESINRKRLHVDRLSELPESLIHHILSFLPTRDVVSTSLLSKRWVDLWTNIPCLDFTDWRDYQRFRTFVMGALIFWKGTKLGKFTIVSYHTDDESFAGDMDVWVRFAVQNKVEELNIHMALGVFRGACRRDWKEVEEDVYRPPRCLYSCSSIRKLSLAGCYLQIHGSVAWNQLHSLKINGFYISESAMNQILLGTPQLEVFDLRLIASHENLNIESTSLKKLKVFKYLFNTISEKPSLDTVLRICCPNLETLEISGIFYRKYLFTNVSSLTEATLGFYDPNYYDDRWMELVGETMKCMLSTLQHIERLTLTTYSVEMIGRLQQEKGFFSPVPNVVFLKVVVNFKLDLDYMVNLLEIFPNLNILVIEDYTYYGRTTCLEFETNVPMSFLLQLKVVAITSHSLKPPIVRYIKFLLKHGSKLEKLIIWAGQDVLRDPACFFKVTETLLRMPRSSPTAEVILKKY